jgi:5-methylcytosine-specific restriction endonuclease McrA
MKLSYKPLKTKGSLVAFFKKYIVNRGLLDRYSFIYKKEGRGVTDGEGFMLWCRDKYCEEMKQDRFMVMVKKLSARCQHHRFYKVNRVKFSTASKDIKRRYTNARNKAITWGLYEDIRSTWMEKCPDGTQKRGLGIQFIHFMESWIRDFEVFHEHDSFMGDAYRELERLQKVEEVELDDFTSAFWANMDISDGVKICYENYKKGMERKQSRRAYRALMDLYRKHYGNRLVSQDARRRHSQRRRTLKSAKKDSKVKTKILAINAGPCKCYWCGVKLPTGGHADHIVPLSKGGSHTCDNIVAACKICNETKKDTMPNSKDLPIHMELQLPLIHHS